MAHSNNPVIIGKFKGSSGKELVFRYGLNLAGFLEKHSLQLNNKTLVLGLRCFRKII